MLGHSSRQMIEPSLRVYLATNSGATSFSVVMIWRSNLAHSGAAALELTFARLTEWLAIIKSYSFERVSGNEFFITQAKVSVVKIRTRKITV